MTDDRVIDDAPGEEPATPRAGRLAIVALAALYAVLLLWNYRDVISPAFTYMKYEFVVESPVLLAIGLLCSAAPAAFLPLTLDRPSSLATWLLFLLLHVPTCLIPLCTGILDPFRAIGMTAASTVGMLLILFSLRGPVVVANPRRMNIRQYDLFAMGGLLACLAIVTASYGFSIRLHSLTDVYDVRADFVDAGKSEASILAMYCTTWLSAVFGPLMILLGIERRSSAKIALGIVVELYIFTITGLKTSLFSTALLVGLYAMFQIWPRLPAGVKAVGAFVGLVLFCTVVDSSRNSIAFSTLFTRRLIITPGLLSGFYHDFFSTHETLRLSHSVFAGLFSYPYSMRSTQLIGEVYFARPNCSANVNIFGDGFANFGYLGALAAAVITGQLLRLYDRLAIEINRTTAALLLTMPAISLSNSALLTCIKTHGLGLAILVVALMPPSRETAAARVSAAGRASNAHSPKSERDGLPGDADEPAAIGETFPAGEQSPSDEAPATVPFPPRRTQRLRSRRTGRTA